MPCTGWPGPVRRTCRRPSRRPPRPCGGSPSSTRPCGATPRRTAAPSPPSTRAPGRRGIPRRAPVHPRPARVLRRSRRLHSARPRRRPGRPVDLERCGPAGPAARIGAGREPVPGVPGAAGRPARSQRSSDGPRASSPRPTPPRPSTDTTALHPRRRPRRPAGHGADAGAGRACPAAADRRCRLASSRKVIDVQSELIRTGRTRRLAAVVSRRESVLTASTDHRTPPRHARRAGRLPPRPASAGAGLTAAHCARRALTAFPPGYSEGRSCGASFGEASPGHGPLIPPVERPSGSGRTSPA